MIITLNGEALECAGTIADLIEDHLHDRVLPGVAVAVNGTVVPRGYWETRRLVDGDEVDVVTAVQGG